VSFYDLGSPDISSLNLDKSGYKAALILAGITNIAECEKNKEKSRKVNVDGTLELIKQLVSIGIKPMFFSSDAVFDGEEGLYKDDSTPNPINEYGRQKYAIEKEMKNICKDEEYLIVRLPKVFSTDRGDGTIFDEMASAFISGGTVRAAYDQIFSPIFILDVIEIVTALQMKNITGIVNVTSGEVWSRYNLALALAKVMGVNKTQVEKISLDDVSGAARLPKNTSMRNDRLMYEIDHAFTPMIKSIEMVAWNWKRDKETSLIS